MAEAPPGNYLPSTYGALGPPQGGAASLLGQPRRYQPNATRAQKPTHVRVPVSTLIGLLLADAIKPVAAARPRASQRASAMLPGLANRVAPPPPSVGSLAALFNPQPTPRTGLNRRPGLGRYQGF